MSINNMNENVIANMAEAYSARFPEQFAAYEKGNLASKSGGRFGSFEAYALGQQLAQYEEYQAFVNENNGGTLASLGQLPNVALDVITAANANSIIPLLASIQPIPEERGMVYHKKIMAQTTQGGFTKGQTINHPFDGSQIRYSESFGAGFNSFTAFETVANESVYTSVLGVPVRPNQVSFFLNDGTTEYHAQDNGQGVLMGTNGLFGTIQYATGTIELKFIAAPAAGRDIIMEFEADLEAQEDITAISAGLDTTQVDAEVFALKAESGILMEFSFQKRFGRSAEDEVASDLTSEMTRVLNTKTVKTLARVARGNTVWYKNPPHGVAYKDHKDTFMDAVADAEAVLAVQAGRGSVNRYIAGTTAAATLRGLPGFQAVPSGVEFQVGLYGYLDGIPVIRATNILADKEILCIYRGKGYFEAPLVYSPYMPLFVSNTMQVGKNPLRNQRVAAVWAGFTPVIKQFVTKITINDTDPHPTQVVNNI